MIMPNNKTQDLIRTIAQETVKYGACNTTEGNYILGQFDFGTLWPFVYQYMGDFIEQLLNSPAVSDAFFNEDGEFDINFFTNYCPLIEDELEPDECFYQLSPAQKAYLLNLLDFGAETDPEDEEEQALIRELQQRDWYIAKGSEAVYEICKEADWEDDFPYVLAYDSNGKDGTLRFHDCISWDAFVATMKI